MDNAMAEQRREMSPRLVARIGGALYLFIIVVGGFGEAFRDKLTVSSDATATAMNIRAAIAGWRLHVGLELLLLICAVVLLGILYMLLRPVNRDLAGLSVFFNVISIAIEAVAALYLLGALFPLDNPGYLKTLPSEQLYAMTSLAIRYHSYGFGLSLIFFGCFCLIIGYLIAQSGYFPKTIGVLMQIAGACYLVNSFVLIVAPRLEHVLFPAILLPALVGELSLCLYLLIKGVNLESGSAAFLLRRSRWSLRPGID